MTQNAEHKHRTQDANTAHNRLHLETDVYNKTETETQKYRQFSQEQNENQNWKKKLPMCENYFGVTRTEYMQVQETNSLCQLKRMKREN